MDEKYSKQRKKLKSVLRNLAVFGSALQLQFANHEMIVYGWCDEIGTSECGSCYGTSKPDDGGGGCGSCSSGCSNNCNGGCNNTCNNTCRSTCSGCQGCNGCSSGCNGTCNTLCGATCSASCSGQSFGVA